MRLSSAARRSSTRRPARASTSFCAASFDDLSVSTTATVERIIDGDTLVVRGGARVRLVQIDAPESGEECYAAASTRELTRLSPPGSPVVLESDTQLDRVDRYGRLLRYIHAGGRTVNLELVRRGAATPWFYDGDRGRYATRLFAATTAARAAQRGMWGRAGSPGDRTDRSLPDRGRASLVRGTFDSRTRTFGAATQDLKWAPERADDAEL